MNYFTTDKKTGLKQWFSCRAINQPATSTFNALHFCSTFKRREAEKSVADIAAMRRADIKLIPLSVAVADAGTEYFNMTDFRGYENDDKPLIVRNRCVPCFCAVLDYQGAVQIWQMERCGIDTMTLGMKEAMLERFGDELRDIMMRPDVLETCKRETLAYFLHYLKLGVADIRAAMDEIEAFNE